MLNALLPLNPFFIDDFSRTIVYRDIFVFRNIFNTVYADDRYRARYVIQSGETPASVAYSLYTSERYEWIIHCMNNIVNPYYEWPLTEDMFYKYVEEKYLNKKCLFLQMDSFSDNFEKNQTIFNSDESASAVVTDWDRTYCKLTIVQKTGTFEINDLIKIGSGGSNNGRILRLIDRAEDALHHFESSGGAKLDPYVGYLSLYLNNNESNVITNKQYEEQLNNSKRTIYVLRPQYARNAEMRVLSLMKAIS